MTTIAKSTKINVETLSKGSVRDYLEQADADVTLTVLGDQYFCYNYTVAGTPMELRQAGMTIWFA